MLANIFIHFYCFITIIVIILSFANDGLSGHRRSGRIQGIRGQTPKKQDKSESQAAQKPSKQNPSLTKRQRENTIMV